MGEALTTEEQALLAKTISEALSGRISINFMEVPKIIAAAKKVGSSREHVVQGLANWLRNDPQAQDLILRAVSAIGSKIFTQNASTAPPSNSEPDVG